MASNLRDRAMAGYSDVHTGAALQPSVSRGVVALRGRDAVPFLHAILTNDVAALEDGQACYAAYLTPQGRMISDMHVLRRAADVVLELEPAFASTVAERLDRSIFSEEVAVIDLTPPVAAVTFHGPAACDAVASVLDIDDDQREHVRRLALLRHVTFTRDEGEFIVLSGDWLGVPGFRVIGPSRYVSDMQERAVARGVPALSDEALQALRLEAGMPIFGIDMDEQTIPLEAGLEARAISMTKGCYIGQEVIVRILHRGHGRVARRLVGLILQTQDAVEPGTPLFESGTEAGHLTSIAYSPAVDAQIALGYVKRDLTLPGHELRVGAADGPAARVAMLPFAHRQG